MNRKGRRVLSLISVFAMLVAPGAQRLSVSAYTQADEHAGMKCATVASGDCDAYIEAISYKESGDGKAIISSRILELIGGKSAADATRETSRTVLLGGGVFGTRIKEPRLTVGSVEEGSQFKEGDKLISINGRDVKTFEDVKNAMKSCGGQDIIVVCLRGGKSMTLKCTPKKVGDEYRLGISLREGAAGIGTVTYIDPATGEFGGLGHGICDAESGEVLKMTGGTVTDVILGGVVRGEAGKPGELSGILTDKPLGEIYANTDCGIFGKLTSIPKGCGTPITVAEREEVHAGKAEIVSTLKNGATMRYSVELSDVKSSATGTKCFKIKVTDNALLAISGGIVRGMSGSPIIQDGKLVGAVTHVLVDDPASGYGIFIENMLSASKQNALPKAA